MLGSRSRGKGDKRKHLVLQSLHPRKFEEHLHTDHGIQHYVKSIDPYSIWILAVLNIIRSAIGDHPVVTLSDN
jgi:hypothetical protein